VPDETTGPPEGPPVFPGNAPPPPPPPMPPPMPPTYPNAPAGGYPPPSYGGEYPGESTVPYASWGARLGGYLIDLVIFIPLIVVLYVIFRHTHTLEVHLMTRRGTNQTQRNVSLLPLFLSGIAYIVYVTIMCGGRRGQTVGMMAIGARLVRAGTHDTVGYGRAFGRALVEQIFRILGSATVVLGIVWLLDMLFPLWDKRKQTLHDKIANTVVIRVRNAG
jgi:uncharacterized RDD family membrane protein YckC